jgi:hypothetical protein
MAYLLHICLIVIALHYLPQFSSGVVKGAIIRLGSQKIARYAVFVYPEMQVYALPAGEDAGGNEALLLVVQVGGEVGEP